ncbi:hypothetical protein [Idiomarina sp.]|uniref:hypothetical protein n=1 Tax=Idiomarina sp. TaxID=1874361 RepID=UPI003A958049
MISKLSSRVSLAPEAERPFPNKEILWGSQEGGQSLFPTTAAAYERKYSSDAVPLEKFCHAVANAQERVWMVDEYLLMPDRGNPVERIDKILEWLPLWLDASDIRLLTKPHQEISKDDLRRFYNHAMAINSHDVRRTKECRIEVRMHLTKDCDFVHDRFAIIDDELWHFGGTVGGFHSKVSATSRGWRAEDHGAIRFFEEIWDAGVRK